MTFKEYQAAALKTAIYPRIGNRIVYPTLGLVNEAGEVAGKVKKLFRDGALDPVSGMMIDDEKYFEAEAKIVAELGDVLWYLSQIATDMGIDLGYIARLNLRKLEARSIKGTLRGEGDER